MEKNNTYDAIVVGTGPGGATVARELSRKGQKVLILEMGKNPKIRASKLQMLFMAGIPGESLLYSSGVFVVRGITTGGSSIFYYATAYDPPYEMLEKYGIDIRDEVAETKAELPYAPLSDDLIGPMATRIMESANAMGYDWQKLPKLIFQDKCKADCWRCVYGCPYGAKWTAREYLSQAIENKSELRTKAKVEKVLINHGKAVGVEYTTKRKTHKVYADNIIISAGGIGSSIILRQSGFKDAGYNYFLDPLVTVMGQVDGVKGGKEIPMAAGVHLEDGILMTDMTVSKAMYRGFNFAVARFGKMFSHSKTLQIMVKVKDSLGGMLNDDGGVRKALSNADIQKLISGAEQAQEILKSAGAKDPHMAMVLAAHPGGTAKVNELVDSNLKTEYDNLYVCDCSVVPETPGVPPTLMLIGLGKRLARHIAG